MDDNSLEFATSETVNGLLSQAARTAIPVDPASSTYYDVVVGSVFARKGLSLAVRGATLIRQDGSVRFSNRDILVTMGSATSVTSEDGLMGELDTDAIVVGQRIIVFGDAFDGVQGVEIDAIDGHVRLGLTTVMPGVFENGRRRHRPCVGRVRSR